MRVSSFDLTGRHFIRVNNDPLNSNSLSTGFYNELYRGKIAVLERQSKSIQKISDISGSIISYFSNSKDYYLLKGGKYYKVNSQGAFLDVLKDHKKEVKDFIRANNIKYKTSPELAMESIAAYYDHLTN